MKVNAGDFSATYIIAVAVTFLFLLPHKSVALTEVCRTVTHRQLCDALTKGSPDALSATVSVAEKLIQMTNRAKLQLETTGPKTEATRECIDNYNLAIQDIGVGLSHVQKDKYTFTSNVHSAICHYAKCDAEEKSPAAQLSGRLSNTASTCLEIAAKIP
ncbi:hypothetical protein LINPERPRIM_LOCUS28219 [Linum perenne]